MPAGRRRPRCWPIAALVILLALQAFMPAGHALWCHGDGLRPAAMLLSQALHPAQDDTECPVCRLSLAVELPAPPDLPAGMPPAQLGPRIDPPPASSACPPERPDIRGRSPRGPPVA